ncbi:MAG TPA: hypothetical protein VIT42_09635 [Microlunatus sp.]
MTGEPCDGELFEVPASGAHDVTAWRLCPNCEGAGYRAGVYILCGWRPTEHEPEPRYPPGYVRPWRPGEKPHSSRGPDDD